MNQGILKDFKPLAEVGALSRIQYLKQQQEVRVPNLKPTNTSGTATSEAGNFYEVKVAQYPGSFSQRPAHTDSQNDLGIAEIESVE